jgi:hypothetical protein
VSECLCVSVPVCLCLYVCVCVRVYLRACVRVCVRGRQVRLQLANDALSLDHKIAFLMASHPRLGRHSPAHILRLVRDFFD